MAIINEAKDYKIFTNCFSVLADHRLVAFVLSVGESGRSPLYYTNFLLFVYSACALFFPVCITDVFLT